MTRLSGIQLIVLVLALGLGCGDDETEADRKGVGAQCAKTEDCASGQQCLAFKGGYCGVQGCTADTDCPQPSACVKHTDGVNYCFRTCVDKPECNANRSVENESNCSANVSFVEGTKSRKACVPPSSS